MIMTVCVVVRMLSFSVKYLRARLYNSSIVTGGSKDSEWKKGVDEPEAAPKDLKDSVYAISLYLLDSLPEPPCEVLYGFLFLLYNRLQRANVPLLSYRTKIPRDECSPKLIERVY